MRLCRNQNKDVPAESKTKSKKHTALIIIIVIIIMKKKLI